jgi:tetratricopeptide (TPR) repeat protein
MLDRDLYGPGPTGFHATNLCLHILNAIGLFWLLKRMTGAIGRSAFVAALFALHPLHVESVAWVAERKDVLSTFFGILTIWTYVRFTEKATSPRYILLLCFFALSLMAKPMLVTLPCLLLLLDVWPLKRIQHPEFKIQNWKPLFQEKIPLFGLSAMSSIITIWAQQNAIGLSFPLQTRVLNAALSYLRYLVKMFLPDRLYVNYPYPQGMPIWYPLLAGLILAVVSWLAIRETKKRPYVLVGWLWFLIALVPVIGLVQVGIQSMADRYTYVPLIGLFIIAAWLGNELLQQFNIRPPLTQIIATVMVAACLSMTWIQVSYWKNSFTLFQHALRLNPNNFFVEVNLALAYEAQGNHRAAAEHLTQATHINPTFGEAYNKLGWVQTELQQYADAVESFGQALKCHGTPGLAHYGMAIALEKLGRLDEAAEHIQSAMTLEPGNQEDIDEYNLILDKQTKLHTTNSPAGHD